MLRTMASNGDNEIIYLLPDTPTKFKAKEDLIYPEKALDGGISGLVVLNIKLNKSTEIEDSRVVFASDLILEESVNKYFSSFGFTPQK